MERQLRSVATQARHVVERLDFALPVGFAVVRVQTLAVALPVPFVALAEPGRRSFAIPVKSVAETHALPFAVRRMSTGRISAATPAGNLAVEAVQTRYAADLAQDAVRPRAQVFHFAIVRS